MSPKFTQEAFELSDWGLRLTLGEKDMSAQLSQHVTTRLLIAEKSENAAHEIDSILRNAGIATKLTVTDDLAHVAQIVSQGEADIALLTDKIDGLAQLLPRVHKSSPHVPLIVLNSHEHTDSDQTLDAATALELGATDVVRGDCGQHLALVVKRELQHVCEREHLSQVRRALNEAEQRCQLLLQGSKAAIAYVHEGMHIHANEGYLNLFGYADLDDLCGASLVDILSEESAAQLKTHLKNIRGGQEQAEFDFVAKSADDSDAEIRGSMTLEHSQYEGEPCLQVTVRSQSAAASTGTKVGDAPEQSSNQSNGVSVVPADELALTGFVKAAETLSSNGASETFVLFAAIDHFSELKSAYTLLGVEGISRKVWQSLSATAAHYPMAKFNGQQFVIAITADDHHNADEIADEMRRTISELVLESSDKTVRPTVTITGVPVLDGKVADALDEAYDLWVEVIDRGQTNSVHIPSPEADDANQLDGARVVINQITEAIEKKMFVLLFQPIISLRGDSDEHYEVFLRMTNDLGEQLEPSKFLQTAIDNNVAGKIDRWVILQSIKMLSVHRAKGHATRLTINLTSNSVTDKEFLQWLTVAIKAARLPSDAVIFQITEKDATTYLRQTREFVEGLRNMHCRASLSRFGLIDDPFETLRHVPVDMVKLDGASVIKMGEDDADSSSNIVETIKKLQGNGKLTIVPMVENASVLSTLWQAGANYIQGHYLQEPSTEMNYDFSTED